MLRALITRTRRAVLLGTVLSLGACESATEAPSLRPTSDVARAAGEERITVDPARFAGFTQQVRLDRDFPLLLMARPTTAPSLARASVLAFPGSTTWLLLLPQTGPGVATREYGVGAPLEVATSDIAALRQVAQYHGASLVGESGRTLMLLPPAGTERREALFAALSAHPNFDWLEISPSGGPSGGCRDLTLCQ